MKNSGEKHVAVPDDLKDYIFTGETIVNIQTSPTRIPDTAPSPLEELYRLARAQISDEIAEFSPVLASLSLPQTGSNTKELHRYEALFGRDSLRVAMDMLSIYPQLTRVTLLTLAELQGLAYNTSKEEEPGRIIHEYRATNDPFAHELTDEHGWGWPYYGSVDATPEFIRTLAAYCRNDHEGMSFLFQKYTDQNGKPQIMADALGLAIEWLERRLDTNSEGLVESLPARSGSIENQVWKDSWDAYFHHNGTIADHSKGVASVEVQRIAYDALLDAAELFDTALGRQTDAQRLRDRAKRLREAIFKYFWIDEKGGYFALGTDRDKEGTLRRLKVVSSNMGHLLNSRLLEETSERAEIAKKAIITKLFSPEMLSQYGIRTLASNEVRYRPGAYHNGSVWLWDSHVIVRGLRRHGYHQLAANLSERLFSIITKTRKFPEFVRSDDRSDGLLNTRIVDVWDDVHQRMNRVEQPPQEIQAWSVAAVLAMQHYNATNKPVSHHPVKDELEASILNKID